MNSRDSRQGFLGLKARQRLNLGRVGVVGYSGGGSHIVQQFAHVLVPNLTVFEPQSVEDTNLNRLVGARIEDIGKRKLVVADRVVGGLMPMDGVRLIAKKWQHAAEELRQCDIVVGCVDSPAQRRELESECRRWLIPYVDIGLGIVMPDDPDEDPNVAGQVAISVPGEGCLQCMGIYSDRDIGDEAQNYGDPAPAPQVVWSNGVLASLAVGFVVEALTSWKKKPSPHKFLRYDSTGCVSPAVEATYMKLDRCPHFPRMDAGPFRRQRFSR